MNSLTVTEIIARSLENGCKEMLRKGIRMCAEKYGFSSEEALLYLEIDGIKLERKVMRRSKGKKNKERRIEMPFSKEMVCMDGCSGLRYNGGLYTQCENKRGEGEYCGNCSKEGIANGTGIPDNGNVEGRMKVGLMDFKDPKGRSPKEYVSVLKKQKVTLEEAIKEAGKLNYIIDNIHLEKNKKSKKVQTKVDDVDVDVDVVLNSKKGRPKKEKKEIETQKEKKEEVKDLFAELLEETIEKVSEMKVSEKEVESEVQVEKKSKVEFVEEVIKKEEKKEKKVKKNDEEKAQAKADALAAKEKAKSDAKVEALLAKEKAKAEAKLAAKELAKATALSKKNEEKKVEEVQKEEVQKEEEPVVEEKKKVTVTRFEFEGKKYLKSSENILYDADTKEEMGIWCEETKSIKALPEDDDDEEEEEEEYEE